MSCHDRSSKSALEALVDRAAAMAREAPEDPWSGLAPEDRLLRGDPPALDNDDHGDPSPVELKERSLAMALVPMRCAPRCGM